MIDKDRVKQLGPQTVEINLSHPLVIGLNEMRATNPERARIVAEQVRLRLRLTRRPGL